MSKANDKAFPWRDDTDTLPNEPTKHEYEIRKRTTPKRNDETNATRQ